jgi:hypothetical protein
MTSVASDRWEESAAAACSRCGSTSDVASVTFRDRSGELRSEPWCASCKQAKLVRTRSGRARRSKRSPSRRADTAPLATTGRFLSYAGYLLLAAGAVVAAFALLGIINL